MSTRPILKYFDSKKELFIILLILSVGIFLRFFRLGKQSLWLDETYSVLMSNNVGALWFGQIDDSSPPGYYTLLYFWKMFFGDSAFSLRFLSAFLGSLLIPAIFMIGKAIFNKRVALYAALLIAISPIHIYYSQEIRMYSLLPLLFLISLFMLYQSILKKNNIYWVLYCVTVTTCGYIHNYGLFLIPAGIIMVIFLSHDKAIIRKFIVSLACIVSAYLPRLLVVLKQTTMDMNPWISSPGLGDLEKTFTCFSLLSWRLPITAGVSIALRIALPLFIFLFMLGLYLSYKQKKIIFLLSLILPLFLAFVISFKIPIYVAGRYDISVLPAFCLIIAIGLAGINNNSLRTFLLMIILAATATILYHYYFVYSKSNDRRVAQYIQNNAHREDIIVATELSITPLEYYIKQLCRPKLFQFPEGPRGFLVRKALKGNREYIASNIEKIKSKIYPLLNKENELWLIYQPLVFSQMLIQSLQGEFENISTKNFSVGDNLNQVEAVYIFRRINNN